MKSRGVLLMLAGGVCLLAAAVLTAANRLEEHHGEIAARRAEQILEGDVIPAPSGEGGDGYGTTASQMQTVEIDGREYIGVLSIPSLGLDLPVLYQWSYDLLKEAPCRYSGSFQDDSMIVAGHNYRKHFSGIKNMRQGDAVRFTDVNGTIYRYTVEDLERIRGTDVEGMEAGAWDLTLFTCTYGGQDRMAVRCVRDYGQEHKQERGQDHKQD